MLEVESDAGVPTLTMQAHPAVEPLDMKVPTGGVLEVSANTSTGGPGYHRRMIDDVRAIGERLGIAWQPSNDDDVLDETGYFEGGPRGAVDVAMLAWLRALLAVVSVQDGQFIAIAMPIGYRASLKDQDDVITAMGPRDRGWVARGAADPKDAEDFFAWWGDDRDATHYRNRAIARMWVDVRWAAPVDDESRDHLTGADRDLQRALEDDAAPELPWREWSEIRRLIRVSGSPATDLDRVIGERSAGVEPGARLIGYRRGPVPVTIEPGWTITIPGSFREGVDGASWVGYDQERSVRLASVSMGGKDGHVPSADELATTAPSGHAAIGPGDETLRGSLVIRNVDEDGDQYRALHGVVASAGELLIVTIVPGEDEEWARETYRSITFKPKE